MTGLFEIGQMGFGKDVENVKHLHMDRQTERHTDDRQNMIKKAHLCIILKITLDKSIMFCSVMIFIITKLLDLIIADYLFKKIFIRRLMTL